MVIEQMHMLRLAPQQYALCPLKFLFKPRLGRCQKKYILRASHSLIKIFHI